MGRGGSEVGSVEGGERVETVTLKEDSVGGGVILYIMQQGREEPLREASWVRSERLFGRPEDLRPK